MARTKLNQLLNEVFFFYIYYVEALATLVKTNTAFASVSEHVYFHFIYFRSVDPYRGIISRGYRTCQKIILGFTYNNIYSISYD